MITKLNNLRKSKEEGFTLIELLVVILIIGVLSAIALPIFLNQTKAAKFASVKSDVKNTSTEAILAAGSGNVSTARIVQSTGNLVEIQPGANGAFVVCGAVAGDLTNTWGFNSSGGSYSAGCTMSGQAPDPIAACETSLSASDKAIVASAVQSLYEQILSNAKNGIFTNGEVVSTSVSCVSVRGYTITGQGVPDGGFKVFAGNESTGAYLDASSTYMMNGDYDASGTPLYQISEGWGSGSGGGNGGGGGL